MKNILIAILAIASIGLAGIVFVQQRDLKLKVTQLTDIKTQLTVVNSELKANNETVAHAKLSEARATALQKAVTDSAADAAEQSKKAEQLQQSLASKTNGNPMAEMFKDPKMRDAIKASQKMFIGPMIDKQYAALFKQLNLPDDKVAAIKDLLSKKMLSAADAGMSMLDNSADATQRSELAKQIKADSEEFDAQIKDALGADGFKEYQSYEKTIPDRMTVSQFGDQLSSSATMTSDQQSKLIQALSEARNSFKWTADFNKQDPGANGDYAAMFTQENIDKFAQEREQFDQQFLARAQQILNPDQLTAFKDFQTTQRQMQLAGLKMAAQMFGGKNQ